MPSRRATEAQLVTLGGGTLSSERGTDLVAEIHGETAPLGAWRGYGT